MMKEYNLGYQYGMDICWFLMDENNIIAQFHTGGAILPDIVAQNATDNIILTEYFEKFTPFTDTIVTPILCKFLNPNNLTLPFQKYVESDGFNHYARRGILSFDKTNPKPGNHSIDYHLQVSPVEFLEFDVLPNEIKDILRRKKQKINFKDFTKLDAGYKPWASLFTDYYVECQYDTSLIIKQKHSFFHRMLSAFLDL